MKKKHEIPLKMRPDQNRNSASPMRIRDPSNSYKCYDSIKTPSPIANHNKHNDEDQRQPDSLISNHFHRPASLDSLANSSDQESSEIDDISDNDSITDLGHITGTTSAQIHRKSDLEDLGDILSPNEPVIKAYLEKSHNKCDFKDCGYKKQEDNNNDDYEEPIIDQSCNQSIGSVSSVCSLKNRRNSIASSGSVGRMETIIEEPIEPKVSVKEILARFETLRESAEVFNFYYLIFF